MNKYIVKLSYTDLPLTHCMFHGNCVFRHKCCWWWGSTEGNWELHRQIKSTNFQCGWASRAERICNLPNQSERGCGVLGCAKIAGVARRCMHNQLHASPNHTQCRRCRWGRGWRMPHNKTRTPKQSKDTERFLVVSPLSLSKNSIGKNFSCESVYVCVCMLVCVCLCVLTKILILPAKWSHFANFKGVFKGLRHGFKV